MSPIIKSYKRSNTYNQQLWGSDLLLSKGYNIFQNALDSIQSYRNSSEIRNRRQIAYKVENSLLSFINYYFIEEEKYFFEEILINNNEHINIKNNRIDNSFDLLKNIDSDGIKLLCIPHNIDLQLLKKLYRKASMKYHPDMGGSHNLMVKVNNAYTLFYNVIYNYSSNSSTDSYKFVQIQPISWIDIEFSVNIILACINGDFFAADKALPYLRQAYNYASTNSSDFIGQLVFDLAGTADVICSTCGVLGRFNMKKELEEASTLTSYLYDRASEYYVSVDDISYPGREYFGSEKDLNNQLGVRIVLNHPEKAKNALRLGKIDRKRFDKIMSKFKNYSILDDNETNLITDFLINTGFIQKLSNTDYKIEVRSPSVVNYPNINQKRFDHLDDNQKWEYLKAFSPEGDGILVQKYYHIRTQEILLGIIKKRNSLLL